MTCCNARKSSLALAAWTLLILTIFAPAPIRAQVPGGSVSGRVSDASGAVITNAKVTLENLGTGVSREVASDKDGFYTAPNLLPGNYQISVSATGFSTQLQKGITLTVGGQQTADFTMKVGSTTTTVEVTADAVTVQLTSSAITAVVDSNTVRELPLNGRSWTDLAKLQPGVTPILGQFSAGGGTDRGERGFGAQLSISGGKPVQNNYRLDGISLNDYANGAPGSVVGQALGVDAIQEFSVITSNYSTEYGRTSGGSSMRLPARAPINSMEVPTNFCATAHWMREISLRPTPLRHSSEINLAFRVEVQSRKTGRSFLRITKGFDNPRVSRGVLRCLRM